METGEAAATWLDQRLAADDRWDEGVPDDAAPWVAAAFAGVAALSIEDLAAAADEVASTSDAVAGIQIDVDRDGGTGVDVSGVVALDDWLGNHPAFEPDDQLGFSIDAGDLVAGPDDGPPTGPPDGPAAVLAATASVPVGNSPGLLDPFDEPTGGASVPEADLDDDDLSDPSDLSDLSDDIVTAPHLTEVVTDVGSDVPIEVVRPDVSASDVHDAGAGFDDLLDGSLVTDPLIGLDIDHEIDLDAADTSSAGLTDDVGEDLLDEFGDDGWADD